MFDLTGARILLTGAHGFLGYVYEQLVAHGAKKSHVRTPDIEELDLRIPGIRNQRLRRQQSHAALDL
jgi:thioester reductase-like protein